MLTFFSSFSQGGLFIRYRAAMLFLSRCSIVLLLYGVAASMALASIGSVLAVVFWVLTFDWIRPWLRLRRLPTFWPLILLPFLIVFGTTYSVAPFEYAYRYFSVYSRFFVILVIIIVIDDATWQKRCWFSFFTGAAVTLFSTYLGVWFVLPWSQSQTTGFGANHSVFYDYIAQGVMTSFLAVVALSHVLTEKITSRRVLWLFVFVFAVFSITHLLAGRTGQVVCTMALLGVISIALPPRKALIFAGFFILSVVVLFLTSPVMSQRFTLLVSEIYAYEQGQEMTSIGARLAMWKASLNFYWDQPLWGHGTGSYRWLTERLFTDPLMCAMSCVHPHNQFLFFGVEYGLLGLFIYGWLFVGVAKIVLLVERRYSLILAGLLTIIAVDSFINSPFWISSERNFYTAVLALTMTSFYLNRSFSDERLER
jgi:O-antigen ligase